MAKTRRKSTRASRRSVHRHSSPRSKRRASSRAARRASTARHLIPQKKIVDPHVAQAMKVYEEAMRHFNKQSFRRAKEIFEKVVAGPSRELAERARVHLAICEQRLQRSAPVHLRSADDHYHYAVSQINLARYDEARAHLEKARRQAPKADYIYYALASVAALSGEAEDAFTYLTQAIKLRPENRYHARNDSDFRLLEDDPRLQDLLYPERDRPIGSRPRELRV